MTSLTVIGPGTRRYYFLCRCSCGNTKEIYSSDVRLGKVSSCGCRQGGGTHRISHTDAWRTWRELVRRCADLESVNYGGRGISVCARWLASPEAFLLDMGDRPSPAHSIDRIDNDKGYWCGKADCPECGPIKREPNCRWATKKEQARNMRVNRNATVDGKTQCLSAWAEELGIPTQLMFRRADRHGDEKAVRMFISGELSKVLGE